MIKALFYKGLRVKESKRVRGCDNSTYPKGGVSCSVGSLVVVKSFVLHINISGKNPLHRKSANL